MYIQIRCYVYVFIQIQLGLTVYTCTGMSPWRVQVAMADEEPGAVHVQGFRSHLRYQETKFGRTSP